MLCYKHPNGKMKPGILTATQSALSLGFRFGCEWSRRVLFFIPALSLSGVHSYKTLLPLPQASHCIAQCWPWQHLPPSCKTWSPQWPPPTILIQTKQSLKAIKLNVICNHKQCLLFFFFRYICVINLSSFTPFPNVFCNTHSDTPGQWCPCACSRRWRGRPAGCRKSESGLLESSAVVSSGLCSPGSDPHSPSNAPGPPT